MGTSNITRHIVHYAAQECRYQMSGEMSVAYMVDAWRYANRYRNNDIMLRDVLALGRTIEPDKNADGIREVGVRVGYNIKLEPHLVPDALDRLLENQPDIGCDDDVAAEFFKAYEDIHPFVDGNGRSGSILYNWIRGSLEKPIHPPNLWNDTRRDRKYGWIPSYPHVFPPLAIVTSSDAEADA